MSNKGVEVSLYQKYKLIAKNYRAHCTSRTHKHTKFCTPNGKNSIALNGKVFFNCDSSLFHVEFTFFSAIIFFLVNFNFKSLLSKWNNAFCCEVYTHCFVSRRVSDVAVCFLWVQLAHDMLLAASVAIYVIIYAWNEQCNLTLFSLSEIGGNELISYSLLSKLNWKSLKFELDWFNFNFEKQRISIRWIW